MCKSSDEEHTDKKMNNKICATQKYLGWWAHHNLNKEKLRLSYIIDELEAIGRTSSVFARE
jgi:hypothetical protein